MNFFRRPNELKKISMAGITGRVSGIPHVAKWKKASGPQPPDTDPRTTQQREDTRGFFKTFVQKRGKLPWA